MDNNLINELHKVLPESISFGNFWMYRHQGDSKTSQVNKPSKLNASAIIICTKGEMEITCNFRQFVLSESTIFVSQPHNAFSIDVTENFEGYFIATVDHDLTDYTIDPRHIPELMEKISDFPMLKMQDEECRKLCKSIDMLMEFIREKEETPFKPQIIKSAISTFAYLIADSLYTHIPSIEIELRSMKREKEHFNRFMKILSENYTREREVSFYADKMNLTPRYLTTCIRKVSGHTVSDWIYKFIIKDAKYLLKHSNLTVQQVAYELNFPNQSFFGKFFKKHTGISPGAYRSSINDPHNQECAAD